MTRTSISDVKCKSPVYSDLAATSDVSCDIVVSQGGIEKTISGFYTYKPSLTSTITDVSPRRSGTGGGVTLTITGTKFDAPQSSASVTIAGVTCDIVTYSSTVITCTTRSTNKTSMNVDVQLEFLNQGRAVPSNAKFDYVDVWSSPYSWGGNPPPVEGKSCVM